MLQNKCQKHKKCTSSISVFFKHQYITVTNITKADGIIAASTQLVNVLQDVIPTNIEEQEKEQLTSLASIFHKVAKKISKAEAKKQSIISCQYNMQPRVGKTLSDQ